MTVRRMAAAAGFALLVAACGDSDDDAAPPPPADEVPVGAPSSDPDPTTTPADTDPDTDPDANAGTDDDGTDDDGAGTAAPTTDAPGDTAADTTDAPAAVADPAPVDPDLGSVSVRLETLTSELDQPLDTAVRPGDDAVYVATKVGLVHRLTPDGTADVVFDISDEVSTSSERGLLGIVFDGDWFHASWTDGQGDSRLTSHRLGAIGEPIPVDDRRDLLELGQPFENHNGGDLEIGPDGLLWWALGDGGSGGDPENNGQDTDTLLGSLLRIRPTPDAETPYEVPADNPFVGGGGRPEIWAHGLRNPWKFSIDGPTGHVWIADVGQNEFEEIDRIAIDSPGPRNFGWRAAEGFADFDPPVPADAIDPVHVYDHGDGQSVTGGFVYRGSAIPELRGAYVFGDFAAGWVDAIVVDDAGEVTQRARLLETESLITSFGLDADGELLVVFLEGWVERIVPT